MPPRLTEERAVVGPAAEAALYAVRQAASALHPAVPSLDVVPVHTPGGSPVMDVPGQSRSHP